jgi:hypothetical protein
MAATRPWKTAAAREAANRAAAARGADTRAAGTRAATWSLVQLLNIPLLLFVQLNLLVQLASKGKRAAAREAASRAAYLVARATASREAADHAAAAVRAVVAREARFKGETAGAREAATSTAGAREATWSLMRLLLVKLLNMPLLLSLIVRKRLLVQWVLLVQGKRLLLVKLLIVRLLLFVKLSLLVQLASKGKRAAACEAASRAAYLVARATASREAADHTAATVLFVLIMPLLLFCSCSSLRKTAATPAACFKRIHMSL